MKRGLMIVILMMTPLLAFAEWIEVTELVNMIPEGYEKAWVENNTYDELFYRMMQLGRGITRGDKLLLYGETDLRPNQLDGVGWALSLYTLESEQGWPPGSAYDKGRIVLILSTLPQELSKNVKRRVQCWMFARYEGITNDTTRLPILICDRIAIVKTIFDVETFEYDSDADIGDIDIDYFWGYGETE